MKQFVTLLIICLCTAAAANAQTYLDHLRQLNKGEGTVTIIQDKAIDELINGSKPKEKAPSATEKTAVAKHENVSEKKPERKEEEHMAAKEKEKDASLTATKPEENKEDAASENVDLRKKVMRGSYKVTGYRVQAFAGGNTRADRQKAEAIRTTIKKKFPDQPVYVHFYSPRWICRVGNYRSYEQAHWMLQEIQKMGYKSATIVKGKITVQY